MDPSELVSQEARRIELETTAELIREGIFQRLHQIYKRGSFVQVIFDPINLHWVITLRHTTEGKKFSRSLKIPEAELDERTANVETWKRSLRSYAMVLMSGLRSEMREAGIEMPLLEENGSSYEAGKGRRPLLMGDANKVYEMGNYKPQTLRGMLGYVDEWDDEYQQAARTEQERKEEEAAIDSIKRTLAAQAEPPEEP